MSDDGGAREPSLWQLMALRGGLVGAAMAALCVFALLSPAAALAGPAARASQAQLRGAVAGIFCGGIVAIATIVEERARQWAPSVRRNALAAAMVGAVALIATCLAVLQVIYTVTVITTHSLTAGVNAVAQAWGSCSTDPAGFVGLAASFATILAASAFSSLSAWSGCSRVLWGIAIAPVAFIGLAPTALMSERDPDEFRVLLCGFAAVSVAVPLLVALADRLARGDDSDHAGSTP